MAATPTTIQSWSDDDQSSPGQVIRTITFKDGRVIQVAYGPGGAEPLQIGEEGAWIFQPGGLHGARFVGSFTDDKQADNYRQETQQAGAPPRVIGNAKTGYWQYNAATGQYDTPATGEGGNQSPTPLGGGYIWNPATNAVETLPPQQTPTSPTLHNAPHAVIQQLPDGSTRVVYTDTAGIAQDQAAIDAKNQELEDARNRTRIQAGQADTQAFNSYWSNIINASQQDETAQQNAFTRDYRLLYELPRTQVADENQARLNQYQAAANQGTYETGRYNAGTTAADSRVRAMLETLPYRASPQFASEFAARRAQEAARQPLTPYSADAFRLPAPDLEGARQAGYAQAGVTGGLPSFEQLLQRTPAFATMSPEELKRLQLQMSLAYVPPPSLSGALAGG
jgi:hypothetical protein